MDGFWRVLGLGGTFLLDVSVEITHVFRGGINDWYLREKVSQVVILHVCRMNSEMLGRFRRNSGIIRLKLVGERKRWPKKIHATYP